MPIGRPAYLLKQEKRAVRRMKTAWFARRRPIIRPSSSDPNDAVCLTERGAVARPGGALSRRGTDPPAVLLAAGSPKKRFSLPHSRVLIHQPWMSGLQGQATDIDIHAKEILRIRTILNKILAHHTGQTLERIEKDVERDYIMTAEQSKEYGIIDEVISKRG